jgi:hypothetical protein
MKLPIQFLLLLLVGIYQVANGQQNLIPMPSEMHLEKGSLSLTNGVYLDSAQFQASENYQLAKSFLKEKQIKLSTQSSKAIRLSVLPPDAKNTDLGEEGYRIMINTDGIAISAHTDKGVFYALQTLRQFDIKQNKIAFVSIEDRPAFAWRGFLVDVGRNFQPLDMLKQQIDVMARYKLNVFHFHFTEDIAWRLASKRFPGLTAASNMTRWKGDFYTQADFRELIDYCKARNILFLPEIDMPGHSAAFHRFFGVDMQSDSGMVYIKALLQEFKQTYPDLSYLHIGGDEVKITNKSFMPEITRYVEELGFKTVGWNPGSNLLPQTIRQMWMGGPSKLSAKDSTKYIDSKHLYLNHMDSEETVTTLFFRKIGGEEKQTPNLVGAILCSWPDRAVAKPEDMFLQSAIYPGMVTFAERVWRGAGQAAWFTNLPPKHTAEFNEFAAFENRLLNHKRSYFSRLPFPYVKQQNLTWELIGSYDNQGDLTKVFAIENAPFAKDIKVTKTVYGATIVLRHWWDAFIKGAIEKPSAQTTWYARTKIWSDKAQKSKAFWIGFGDLSRSYASDAPDQGTWDNRKSEVLVNGVKIAPPVWANAGKPGNLDIPLVDEGYSYRSPTLINLKKGWNTVLIKLPVKNFNGKNWQNPEKWMFTFTPID